MARPTRPHTIEAVATDPTEAALTAERAALVALLRQPDASWPDVAVKVLERGSALELLHEVLSNADTLFPTPEHAEAAIAEAAELLGEWDKDGIRTLTILDEDYPAQLREIRELPPILFARGGLVPDVRAIAVVGTRKASERGLRIASAVAETLAGRGVTVVSGLAAGIDTAAHTAALAAGGRTVAVIGAGVRRYYPAENRALQESIGESGLVLSQFWPDAPPRREQFPMRNAVMSGYAAATMVIEAGERSGARIQARLALQHGRPVVLLRDLLACEWARAIAGRPGVSVVDGPDELMAIVDRVLEQRTDELSPDEGVADLAFV